MLAGRGRSRGRSTRPSRRRLLGAEENAEVWHIDGWDGKDHPRISFPGKYVVVVPSMVMRSCTVALVPRCRSAGDLRGSGGIDRGRSTRSVQLKQSVRGRSSSSGGFSCSPVVSMPGASHLRGHH